MGESLLQNEGLLPLDLASDKNTKIAENARVRVAANSTGKKSEEKTTRKRTGKSQQNDEEIQRVAHELDKMFTGENFKGLVRAPADLLLSLTGNKIWDIPDGEIETLATTAATAGRYFLTSDPKWLALTLFSMAALTTYGTRGLMALQLHKKEQAKKE